MKKIIDDYIVIVIILAVVALYTIFDYMASFHCHEISWIYSNSPSSSVVTYFKNYADIHNYSTLSYNHLNHYYANSIVDNYNKYGESPQYHLYRPIENPYANKSVVIFGCDYPYGIYLKPEETFSANLGRALPNYRIYNRARNSWSTSGMLYQMENKNFSEVPNVKCVVYVFQREHFLRDQLNASFHAVPYYKLDKNNKLHFQKTALKYINVTLIVKLKQWYYMSYYATSFNRDLAKTNCYKARLTKAIIKLSKRYAEYRFPGTEFVVLRYDNASDEPYNWMFEELKKEGVTVVSFKELLKNKTTNSAYCQDSGFPNAKAWHDLTPAFVKYMQSKGSLKD